MPDCALHKTHGWRALFRPAGRTLRGSGFVLIVGTALASSAAAQAPRQPSPAPAGPAGEPSLEAARLAFEGLPEADRQAIQDALVWTGDYSSTTTGAFGRRSFEGILAYQRRAGLPQTGILDPSAIARLVAAGARARNAAGFALTTDAATGLAIGVPQKLLPKRGANPNGGARFQSADGRVTLDTRALPGGEAELKELYERNLAIQTPGRAVTYKLLRPDFFVLTGETSSGRFYTRYAAGPEGLRGFSIGYDKALAPELERVVVAISNSFTPFPAPAGIAAAAPTAPAPPAREATGAAAGRGPLALSGVVVAPRRVLTAAAIGSCAEPTVAGGAARVLRVDGARGVALLEPATALRARPAALAPAAASVGDAVMILFVPTGENGRPVVTGGEVTGPGRLVAPLQEGAAGALVVSEAGALVGLVAEPALGRRVVAGLAPPASHPFVAAAELREALGDGAPPGDGRRGRAALAAELGAAVVSVACGPAGRPR